MIYASIVKLSLQFDRILFKVAPIFTVKWGHFTVSDTIFRLCIRNKSILNCFNYKSEKTGRDNITNIEDNKTFFVKKLKNGLAQESWGSWGCKKWKANSSEGSCYIIRNFFTIVYFFWLRYLIRTQAINERKVKNVTFFFEEKRQMWVNCFGVWE